MYKTVEERLAYVEAKLDRLEKVEAELKRTQQALVSVANITDRNFKLLRGRKSDGLLSDLFDW